MQFTMTHSLIGWILIGLLAGVISRGRGFGCLANLFLGLIGAVLGGWIFRNFNIAAGRRGFLFSLAAATLGAVLLVAVARLFSSSND